MQSVSDALEALASCVESSFEYRRLALQRQYGWWHDPDLAGSSQCNEQECEGCDAF